MLLRVIAIAGILALAGSEAVFAQSEGPTELPSEDYQGQSYIDSNGCIFLRAGYGGKATWVPRVGQDRKPVCGQTPTNAIAKVADAVAIDPPASLKRNNRKRHFKGMPPRVPVMIGCPVSVPVPRRYVTTDGGSVVICTATNGSLTGARSPIYPAGSGVGAALSSRRYSGVTIPLSQGKSSVAQNADEVTQPPGYVAAWKDGRFNPMRGKGTVPRQSPQGNVLPQNISPALIPKGVKSASLVERAKISETSTTRHYVQVGAFGEPKNADNASFRLKAIGLPVSKKQISQKGRTLQIVYAGPFSSGQEAHTALLLARSNGFTDAYIP